MIIDKQWSQSVKLVFKTTLIKCAPWQHQEISFIYRGATLTGFDSLFILLFTQKVLCYPGLCGACRIKRVENIVGAASMDIDPLAYASSSTEPTELKDAMLPVNNHDSFIAENLNSNAVYTMECIRPVKEICEQVDQEDCVEESEVRGFIVDDDKQIKGEIKTETDVLDNEFTVEDQFGPEVCLKKEDSLSLEHIKTEETDDSGTYSGFKYNLQTREKEEETNIEIKEETHHKYKTAASLNLQVTVSHATEENGNPPTVVESQVGGKILSHKDNLRDHSRARVAGSSKSKRLYLCTFCNKEIKGSSLAIHVRTHTGEKPFFCDLCPKQFTSSEGRKKHRRIHTGEKPYECPTCFNTFAAKETLNRHVRTHTGDKPHGCNFCGKTFIQADQLRAHIFHHTGENGFSCPHCNGVFNRRNRLTQHMKFVHERASPMVCEQCGRSFLYREDFIRHGHLHSGLKPYGCEICHKSFALKSVLKLHIRIHRKEKACSCDKCGRAFIRQDCLKRHMRAKHRNISDDAIAIEEKKLLQQQLLKSVLDREDMFVGIAYKCDICNKSFALKHSLKLHVLIHRKEDPCTCVKCGRAFIRQDCLMRHMKIKHPDALKGTIAGPKQKCLN